MRREVGQVGKHHRCLAAGSLYFVGHGRCRLAAGPSVDHTSAPAAANSTAIARPIPLDEPVTTAVLPAFAVVPRSHSRASSVGLGTIQPIVREKQAAEDGSWR